MKKELNELKDILLSIDNKHFSWNDAKSDVFSLIKELQDRAEKQDSWLSPIESEREWQKKHLTKIFNHFPDAYPLWQYMNTLIVQVCENHNIEVEYDK